MEPYSLQVYDWARMISTGEATEVWKINIGDSYIADDGLYADERDRVNLMSDLEPLPLEVEMFEKNGFEVVKNADDVYTIWRQLDDPYGNEMYNVTVYKYASGDFDIDVRWPTGEMKRVTKDVHVFQQMIRQVPHLVLTANNWKI